MSRTYNQDCVLAYALDLLGERWTLLIIRELFLGPRRFGDLHAALPGLGTNLLTKRLRELSDAGLIAAASNDARAPYRLTLRGEELRPMVRSMMFWSMHYFLARDEPSAPRDCMLSDNLRPDSLALVLEIFANMVEEDAPNFNAHLFIDDQAYTFYRMNCECTVRRGADAPAVASISIDVSTLMKSMRHEISLREVRARCKLAGDEAALDYIFKSVSPGGRTQMEVAELIAAGAGR